MMKNIQTNEDRTDYIQLNVFKTYFVKIIAFQNLVDHSTCVSSVMMLLLWFSAIYLIERYVTKYKYKNILLNIND